MGFGSTFDGIVEEKLLNLHTAFIGKVVSVQSESVCSVQPIDKIKAYGQTAKQQAVITKVPILNHVRHYSLQTKEEHSGHLSVSPLRAGDIVLCVCAERDITSSARGISTTPPSGHHQIKDAVVVGLFGGW
jgi:hypothetical protein